MEIIEREGEIYMERVPKEKNVSMPFNALSSIQLFDAMGKEKPKA
jgi:hypothetical protein